MKKKDATIACAAFLAGASLIAGIWMWSLANGPGATARDYVRGLMRQPSQVRFESVIFYPATWVVCGGFSYLDDPDRTRPVYHFVSADGKVLLDNRASQLVRSEATLADFASLLEYCPELPQTRLKKP